MLYIFFVVNQNFEKFKNKGRKVINNDDDDEYDWLIMLISQLFFIYIFIKGKNVEVIIFRFRNWTFLTHSYYFHY